MKDEVKVVVIVVGSTVITVTSMWEMYKIAKSFSGQLLYFFVIIIYVTVLANIVFQKNESMLKSQSDCNESSNCLEVNVSKKNILRTISLGVDQLLGFEDEIKSASEAIASGDGVPKANITPIFALSNEREYQPTNAALVSITPQKLMALNPKNFLKPLRKNSKKNEVENYAAGTTSSGGKGVETNVATKSHPFTLQSSLHQGSGITKDDEASSTPFAKALTKDILNSLDIYEIIDYSNDAESHISEKIPISVTSMTDSEKGAADTSRDSSTSLMTLNQVNKNEFLNDPTFNPATEIETPVTRITFRNEKSGNSWIELNRQIVKLPKKSIQDGSGSSSTSEFKDTSTAGSS